MRFATAIVAPTPQTLTVPEGRAEAMGSLTGVSTGPCRRPYSHRRCPCADFTREPVMAALRGSPKVCVGKRRNPPNLLLDDPQDLSMVPEPGLVSRQCLGKRKAHRSRIEKANHRETVTLTLDPNIKGRWRGRTYLAVTTTTAGRRLDVVQ
jgi:hypothetical protein